MDGHSRSSRLVVLSAEGDGIVMAPLAAGGYMMDTGWAPDPQMASTDDTTVIYDTGHAFPLGFGGGFVFDRRL